MLAVLRSASSPTTEVVLFKTKMNVFHGSTKLKGRKLQFNTMPMTNLFEHSHLHSYTEKLPNKLQPFRLY